MDQAMNSSVNKLTSATYDQRGAARTLAAWLPTILLLAFVILGCPAFAQPQTITGLPGVAQGHAVMTARAMAMIEQMTRQTNVVGKVLPLPMPRGSTQEV